MSHLEWALARVDETTGPDGLRSQRAVRELLDSLLTLREKSKKGVFGLSPSSLNLQQDEREVLEARIRAALIANRDAFAKAGDAASLLELRKVADLCNLPELQSNERFALRCDPLGDASSLNADWQALVERMRHARAESLPLAWPRVATYFSDAPPQKVEFGAPDLNALYEFALRYEQSSKKMFSRELAAIWSIIDGILLDDTCWYLAPVKEWSWEDDNLRIGCGHYLQGSLCIEVTEQTTSLADAAVVDRNDDGVEAYRYESLASLLDLLLPEVPGQSPAGAGPRASATNETGPSGGKRPWWKFWR